MKSILAVTFLFVSTCAVICPAAPAHSRPVIVKYAPPVPVICVAPILSKDPAIIAKVQAARKKAGCK